VKRGRRVARIRLGNARNPSFGGDFWASRFFGEIGPVLTVA
jgi:hypothetical protein